LGVARLALDVDLMRVNIAAFLVAWTGLCLGGSENAAPTQGGPSAPAFTKPSADVTLSFVRPGIIAKVLVKEGDAVQAGQMLVRQDDAAEQLELDQLKAEAEDFTRIEAYKKQVAQKKVDVDKLKQAPGATTAWEIDHAQLELDIGELTVKIAEFERRQSQRKFDTMKAQLERMVLTSPIAGRVEKVFLQPGESVEALGKVIRVVNLDPLWIEVGLTPEQCVGLCRQGRVQVRFPQGEVAEGKVEFVAAVAEPVSQKRMVRVVVGNPTSRPAGENVTLTFPALPGPDKPPGQAAVSTPPARK
jgi:RND family efflux transporter MFP subunit